MHQNHKTVAQCGITFKYSNKSENLRLLVVYVMSSIGLVLHLKLFGLHKSHVVMITSISYWKNKTKNVFPQTQVLRGNFRKMILFKKRIPAYEKPTSKFYRMRKISTQSTSFNGCHVGSSGTSCTFVILARKVNFDIMQIV